MRLEFGALLVTLKKILEPRLLLKSAGVFALGVLMHLSVDWDNIEDLQRFDRAVKLLGSNMLRAVAPRALNRTGQMARTQVVRALAKQTGLKQKVIRKAVRTRSAFVSGAGDSLSFDLMTRGGEVGLIHLSPKEVEGGTVAMPFGKRTLYPEAFFRGGVFPGRRVMLRGKPRVMVRKGAARMPIMKAKSGVWIPKEMLQGETAEAFTRTVAQVLPRRLLHEVNRLTGGVLS